MKHLYQLVIAAVFCALTGCASLAKIAPVVADLIVAVEDAEAFLNETDAYMRRVFAAFPDPEGEKRYAAAMSATRASLRLALRSAHGAEDLTKEDADKAFAEFRAAYAELMKVVKEVGGLKAGPGGPSELPPPLVISGPVS